MAQVAGPYGFRIVKLLGDLPFSGGMNSYRMNANNPAAFYFGDPVGIVGGQPTAVAVTPTPPATAATAPTANNPIGIFMGCSYQDPVYGFVNRQYLPAGAINSGFSNVILKIADYPWQVMQIQANGPVNVNQIGLNAGLIITPGNTSTGDSKVALDAASIGATGAAVRIYGFPYTPAPAPGASSQPGDPFTDVLVIWCPGVQRFQVPTGL
jgi:hypothetical protein